MGKMRIVDQDGEVCGNQLHRYWGNHPFNLVSRGGVMGPGVGGAQGDVGGLGERLDHPHWGPWKSPSIIKDQVCLSGDGEICDKGWE